MHSLDASSSSASAVTSGDLKPNAPAGVNDLMSHTIRPEGFGAGGGRGGLATLPIESCMGRMRSDREVFFDFAGIDKSHETSRATARTSRDCESFARCSLRDQQRQKIDCRDAPLFALALSSFFHACGYPGNFARQKFCACGGRGSLTN